MQKIEQMLKDFHFGEQEYRAIRASGLYCGSMRKGTNKERDAELIKRLQAEAPEVLKARVDFDAIIDTVLTADGSKEHSKSPKKQSRPEHKHNQ